MCLFYPKSKCHKHINCYIVEQAFLVFWYEVENQFLKTFNLLLDKYKYQCRLSDNFNL